MALSELDALIAMFARLPGFGRRSARRAVLSLMQSPEGRMLPLAQALDACARAVKRCDTCGNLDSINPCAICTDPDRDAAMICVVEGVGDVWALERAHVHSGVYHVLGGTLSPIAGTTPDDLSIRPLLARIARGGIAEVILALSATVDGATTSHYVADRLAQTGVNVTRVAQGVPIGGALDVLDDGTLATALSARR